jgi:hypothetical protein
MPPHELQPLFRTDWNEQIIMHSELERTLDVVYLKVFVPIQDSWYSSWDLEYIYLVSTDSEWMKVTSVNIQH